jgi:hypothetical protein
MISYHGVRYQDLNPRQQEALDLHKVAAVLADYGFITIPALCLEPTAS